jgi:hypothetical protein
VRHFGIDADITRDKLIIRGDIQREIPDKLDKTVPVEFLWHMAYFFWFAFTQYNITDDNFPEVVALFKDGIGTYMLHGQEKRLYVIKNITEINYCYIKNNEIIRCAI